MPIILMGLNFTLTLLVVLRHRRAYLCDFDRLLDLGGMFVPFLDLFAQ